MLSRAHCEEIVIKFLERNKFFNEAYLIARENWGDQPIYLLGGMVYRPIINELYGIPLKQGVDYDFLVDYEIADGLELVLPEHWEVGFTHLGNYKITKQDTRIDYLPANVRVAQEDVMNVSSMTHYEKAMSYCKQVPLSLQSIAFDITAGKIVGDISLQSIAQKKVWVNCQAQAQSYCDMYGMKMHEYMDKKYSDLGFTFEI